MSDLHEAATEHKRMTDVTLMNFMSNYVTSIVKKNGRWIATSGSYIGMGVSIRKALIDLHRRVKDERT